MHLLGFRQRNCLKKLDQNVLASNMLKIRKKEIFKNLFINVQKTVLYTFNSNICIYEAFSVGVGWWNLIWDRKVQWLVKTIIRKVKRVNGMAMRAINVKIKFCTLSQKCSTGLHEIWHVCSNRHYGYLYSFQGLGNVNFLSSRGSEKSATVYCIPRKVQLYYIKSSQRHRLARRESGEMSCMIV